MQTSQHSFHHDDLVWSSLLDVPDTIELFASSIAGMDLEGFSVCRSCAGLDLLDMDGRTILSVRGPTGVVPIESGVEAFMVLACAMDRFPEVLAAGYRDGVSISMSSVKDIDLKRRYPMASIEKIRKLATRAGLVSAISLRENFTGDGLWLRPVSKNQDTVRRTGGMHAR